MKNFAENENFKLVKLINGEDIICTINSKPSPENVLDVLNPLKMQVIPKMTQDGIEESLNLSHWVHPYTETRSFQVPMSSVLLVATISPGLSRYYEYTLQKIDREDQLALEELDDIDNEEIFDDLLESMNLNNKSVH
jgi:hypothetical protein|tara:strand:- start:1790 stop:2200 length:411 start_codon:yes stop_codon:yes gene_type:complete